MPKKNDVNRRGRSVIKKPAPKKKKSPPKPKTPPKKFKGKTRVV